jgi:hypothetical protein
MNTLLKISSLALLCWSLDVASAQQTEPASPAASPSSPASDPAAPAKRPKATPQAEAGEPRANTSPPAPAAEAQGGEPRTSQPALMAPAPAAPPPAPADSRAPAQRAGSVQPAAVQPAGGSRAGSATAQKGPGGTDRLELGTATVTGDREQPKVMYIVPWKKSDIGDLTGKPLNSLVDEILSPIDRDVFKREVVYYKAVQADASQNGAQGRPSEQGEK